MIAAGLALILYLGYLAVVFGLRTWLLYRRTGTTGYRGLSGPVGSPGWWGGIGFIVALLAGLAAPALQLLGHLVPFDVLDSSGVRAIGFTLTLTAGALTLIAQQAMGRHWRIGVKEDETTELVRSGIFALVRNPFFSALLITATGLTLLAPNPLAVTALIALLGAVELQVRAVEEPYLRTVHGSAYADYTARVGRFVPGIGTGPTGDVADR